MEHALRMIGNFHTRLSQERWGCILQAIALTLQHTESEDFSSGETLFGTDAIKRVKERAEELRTLQSVKNKVCVSRKGDSQSGGPSGCHPQQKDKESANPHCHCQPKFHPFQSNQKNKIGRIRPSPPLQENLDAMASLPPQLQSLPPQKRQGHIPFLFSHLGS